MEIGKVNVIGEDRPFKVDERRTAESLDDLPTGHLALLKGPVFACLATTGKDGRTQLSPMWVNHDGEFLQINSAKGRIKDFNMRARPEVAVLLINPENPFHWMSINGRVVDIVDEEDPARGREPGDQLNDLAECYINQRPYPFRDPKGEVRVLYKVKPDKILTFGDAG